MATCRHAVDSDAKAIAQLVTQHEKSFDDEAGITSTEMAGQLIKGIIDPTESFVWERADGILAAFLGMNPDSIKKTLYTDVYSTGEVLDEAVDFAVEVLERDFPDWKALPGVNTKDADLIAAWARHGFTPVRTYWQMRAPLVNRPFLAVPDGYRLATIDVSSDAQLRQWHALHLDAFSEHFGFVPRPFDGWKKLVIDIVGLDVAGNFLLLDEKDNAVGYVECSDELVEDNFGFVNHLGVAKSHRGRGLGEFLLRHACAYSATKGYEQLELSVDTGNETGALALYEKVGFVAGSSWQQVGRDGASS
ncbi:MAG: GNAT family N-acetyltransferase [Microbacteriaceae bacterium]|nr:GNAT family N-acetyltransferase [Microbacteriaceae bacterium]